MSTQPDQTQNDRLTNLELLFTHLERQVGELQKVLLNQQHQIEQLEKQIRRVQAAPSELDDESDE
jgi:uncharacterized coiled-coil protein SlyX